MLEIIGNKVILRDFIKEDIDDRIKWETIETEWLEWDAPWEAEEEPFNHKKYSDLMEKKLCEKQDPNRFRYGFQICINDEIKKHIGWINAYKIDDEIFCSDDDCKLAIGIGIPDLSSRRKGYATEAWDLYIKYLLDNGTKDIYTQTWSGNIRVIGLIKKLGFEGCYREESFRIVRGVLYDGLTFKLNIERYKVFVKGYNIIE